jgi:hypothetical protein
MTNKKIRRENKAINVVMVLTMVFVTLFFLPFPMFSIPSSFICGFFVCRVIEDINEDIGGKK